MNDEELLLQAAHVPTAYFDGFGAFRKINGVLRCVGYIIGGGAQLNLIVSLTGAKAANIEAHRVLSEESTKHNAILTRLRIPH
jgi:hypothetical protein